MDQTANAVLTRNAAAAALETFQRIYPGVPSGEQLRVVQLAMAQCTTSAMRRFVEDARREPHNTEAHYVAAVLAIASAGVRAILHVPPVVAPAPAPASGHVTKKYVA